MIMFRFETPGQFEYVRHIPFFPQMYCNPVLSLVACAGFLVSIEMI